MVHTPTPTATSSVGIDLGVANFATLSDGTFVKPLNSFKRHEVRLARYQRRMARKVKCNCNWKKAKRKVQKAHATVANARDHALVVVEALKVKNMTTKGKQKRGLNKAILDQGWFEFKRQLEYKLSWSGGLFVKVSATYTSQICSQCGHVHKNNRKTQSTFTCVACGHRAHADVNAAKNILARGHRAFACGETVSQPTPSASAAGQTKQESAEEFDDHLVVDSVGIPT